MPRQTSQEMLLSNNELSLDFVQKLLSSLNQNFKQLFMHLGPKKHRIKTQNIHIFRFNLLK